MRKPRSPHKRDVRRDRIRRGGRSVDRQRRQRRRERRRRQPAARGSGIPLGGEGKKRKATTVKERRDEFTFHTARDAAEFQRVVLVLRTAGRDVGGLYDALCEGFD